MTDLYEIHVARSRPPKWQLDAAADCASGPSDTDGVFRAFKFTFISYFQSIVLIC